MTRNLTPHDAKTLLEHARWHCLFGSDPMFSRDAEPGDVAAAELLSKLLEGIA